MAVFYTTRGISVVISEIIERAKKRIVLISPYLQLNILIKQEIELKLSTSPDLEVWLIFREEDKLRPEDKEWLERMPSIKQGSIKNLHAKCYMSESYALVTSMNLYQFSQQNNNEMGILVTAGTSDNGVYKAIEGEVRRLATMSGIIQAAPEADIMSKLRGGLSSFFRPLVGLPDVPDDSSESSDSPVQDAGQEIHPIPETPPVGTDEEPDNAVVLPLRGFCLRCRADLPANPAQPYCGRCYASWRRYKNNAFKEKHCHTCGTEHVTTMLKPLCDACLENYRDALELALPF